MWLSPWAEAHNLDTLRPARCVPSEFPGYLVICCSLLDTSKFKLISFFFCISILLSANFSQPEINLIPNQTENSNIINLTCSSTQGYPEPQRMYILLKTKNSTTEHDTVMKKSQNNITELYNVSISMSFSIPPKTNVSIFCVLQLEPTKTLLFSPPCNIGKPDSFFYQVLYTDG